MNKFICPAGKFKIPVVLLMLLSCLTTYAQSVYYVDANKGNDHNPGHSITTPWKTLSKLNNIIFQPGDKILLKRGQIFYGSLNLKGQGTASNRIQISAYGTGRRPVISSTGHNYSLQLMDTRGWNIEDIETKSSKMAGIFISCTKDSLEMGHFRINNCYVHDIGDTAKLAWYFSTTTGGIIVANWHSGKDGKLIPCAHSVFSDVVISNCIVRYNYRWTCISITSGIVNGARGNANYIKNCAAEYSSADGIRMNGVQNSFIEYCTMYRNGAWPKFAGKNLGGLGAWFFNAESCTIQYCEAGYVRASNTDGGAFDIDYLQKNSTVQYCYGHDCAGYGVSVFGADHTSPTENAIVRYNILSNNGRDPAFAYEGDFFIYTWGGGLLNGVKVYDNTSYWNPTADSAAVKIDADFTGNNPNIFSNNVIYSKRAKLTYLKNDTMQCDSNHYHTAAGINPQWQFGKKVFQSLTEWQQETGKDKHSQINGPVAEDTITQSKFKTSPLALTLSDKWRKTNAVTLISFIDFEDPGMSQAQLVFIKSMKNQYAQYGLKVILINESHQPITNAKLNNFISDNELRDVVFIQDDIKKGFARKYGVTKFPTTFILSKEEHITHKEEALMPSSALAMAIEKVLGEKLLVKHFNN